MAKKSKASEHNWYKDNYVSDAILNKPLDYSKGFKWSHGNNNDNPYDNFEDEAIAREEYERQHLTFYANKENMRKYMGNDFWNTHDIDKYWSQYLKRDLMVANGQYAQIKLHSYRDSYISTFEHAYGGDPHADYIIKQIKNLTDDEFYAITHIPVDKEFWKKDKRTGKVIPTYQAYLPNINDFYPTENADIEETLTDFEDSMKQGYEKIGKKYKDYNDYENENKQEEWHEDAENTIKDAPILPPTPREVNLERNKNLLRTKHRKVNEGIRAMRRYGKSLPADTYVNIMSSKRVSKREVEIAYIMQHEDKIKTNRKGKLYMPFMKSSYVREAKRRIRNLARK